MFVSEITAVTMARREEAIIDVFERNTYSVANIFDITLQVHRSGLHAATAAGFPKN